MKIVATLSTFLMIALMLTNAASAASSETEAQLINGAHAYQSGDYANALSIFLPLAESGNASAQSILGTMYYEARGVEQDDAEALRWFQSAAAQGEALAQVNLGGMYALGRGLPTDLARAYMWYDLAAPSLNEEYAVLVRQNRDGVAEVMTAEQLEAAREMVIQCQQSNFQDCE